MAKTLIIKLLGRRISFNALLLQVTMVWKTRSSFQLMDMENDFYFVCFNDKDDYCKVMIRGPWVIFRQYLTVHPWMPNFLHTNIGIDAQVLEEKAFGLWMVVEKRQYERERNSSKVKNGKFDTQP
ncbi:hypothetical protein Golob_025010 [Gossypium lobatum]|uniref:DUF4283 domain-containing protein n=1 Tax=Gossypium lobatum TaxID=34289 RepID=A0A7J8NKW9_9ROSI|nr:hypothetical protein [Gossypium lobatum]